VIRAGADDAPPLVMLHGKTTSSTMWLDHLPLLAENRRVYLIDTIGDMNKSVATRMLGTTDDVNEWLDSVLDALELDQVAIAGLSYGAFMATTYAMARPQRVERVAIISPAGVFSSARPVWVAKAIYAHMVRPRREVAERFTNTTCMPDTVARMAEIPYGKVVEQYLVGVPGFKMARDAFPKVYKADKLATLAMPALVVIGENETVCDGPKSAAKARERVPAARVELVPQSNHMVTVDQPEILGALLTEFLAAPK
jgi:pimeloyl-ACP methyl ester carboxylesterase